MRDRMTKRRSRSSAKKNILAEIAELEKMIKADEQDELEMLTDDIELEDAEIAEESTGVPVDVGVDQNEMANENWPVEASDEEIEGWADDLESEEIDIVTEGTDVPVSEGGNQNDKAMKNWPVANREAVASRLIKLAKALLKD